jgi:hypothetical protein
MSVYAGPADWWTDNTGDGRNHVSNKGLVRSGLISLLDASSSSGYSGSGSTLNDLSGNGNNGTLNGTYNYFDNYVSIENKNALATGNVSYIQSPSLTNITTVSFWFNPQTETGIARYLLDMRTGGAGGWIYSVSSGSNWSTGKLYFNGGNAQSISWATINASIGTWRNVTVVANTPATDNINLFGRNSNNEGYDVLFGMVLIYNREITKDENQQNFNALRGRFSV